MPAADGTIDVALWAMIIARSLAVNSQDYTGDQLHSPWMSYERFARDVKLMIGPHREGYTISMVDPERGWFPDNIEWFDLNAARVPTEPKKRTRAPRKKKET